jgi:hypothetical protein
MAFALEKQAMHRASWLTTSLGLALWVGVLHGATDKASGTDRTLAEAARKTSALSGYSFTIEETPGQGTGGTFSGKYAKGQPVFFTADKIEFFKKGDALVYKDGEKWQRSKTGIQSDPLRILGAAAKVRGARLPHEELPELVKALQNVKKAAAQAEGTTVYTGTLNEEGAKKLTPAALRSVARDGQAQLWVGGDGQVHKYALTIRVQGKLGNAEIDSQLKRTVTLGDRGTARVELPEAAKKALE